MDLVSGDQAHPNPNLGVESENCLNQERPELAGERATPRTQRAPRPLTPAIAPPLSRELRGPAAHALCRILPSPLAHAPPLSRATGDTAHHRKRACALAHCLPGIVVSVLWARQVQWLRSGAAAPEGRGGSGAATWGPRAWGRRSRGADKGRGTQEGRVCGHRPRGRRQGKARPGVQWSE